MATIHEGDLVMRKGDKNLRTGYVLSVSPTGIYVHVRWGNSGRSSVIRGERLEVVPTVIIDLRKKEAAQ